MSLIGFYYGCVCGYYSVGLETETDMDTTVMAPFNTNEVWSS